MRSPSTKIAPESISTSWLMQRSKVVLPEPEAPMMQSTSLAATSSETPASASKAPKLLRTSRIETRGVSISSSSPLGRAPGEAALEQHLQRGEDGDDDEVPKARDDQELDDARVGVINIFGVVQDLGVLDHARKRGELDHAYEFIAERRKNDAHRLRQDDALERTQARHADRLRRLILPGIDRDEPRAHHLGGVGALIDAEPEKRRRERRHHVDGAGLEEAGDAHHGKDQREIEPKQQLQDDGRAPEKPSITDRDAAHHRIVRHAHDGEENAEHDAEPHGQNRHDD